MFKPIKLSSEVVAPTTLNFEAFNNRSDVVALTTLTNLDIHLSNIIVFDEYMSNYIESSYNPIEKDENMSFMLKTCLIVSAPIWVPIAILSIPVYLASEAIHSYEVKRKIKKQKQIDKKIDDNYKKRINEEWQYRLYHISPHINHLPIWQKYILECNQYERAIMQIIEANDVPYEIWKYIEWSEDEFEFKNYLIEQMKKYGTPEYEKETSVRYVIQYYTEKYAKFKNTSIEEIQKEIDILLEKLPKKFDTFEIEGCNVCD